MMEELPPSVKIITNLPINLPGQQYHKSNLLSSSSIPRMIVFLCVCEFGIVNNSYIAYCLNKFPLTTMTLTLDIANHLKKQCQHPFPNSLIVGIC